MNDEGLAVAAANPFDVSSAREAFATFLAWRPDVIVSDIEMPEEDGYMLIRKIRALRSRGAHHDHRQSRQPLDGVADGLRTRYACQSCLSH
jgi:CheY-like chemotaxis protein